MTAIKIFRDQNKDCIGYEISGHAEFDDSGRDIVCAAISILATTTHNAIEKLTSDKFGHEEDEDSGKCTSCYRITQARKPSYCLIPWF